MKKSFKSLWQKLKEFLKEGLSTKHLKEALNDFLPCCEKK